MMCEVSKHPRQHAYIYHFEIHAKAADIDHAVSVLVPARLWIGRTLSGRVEGRGVLVQACEERGIVQQAQTR
jgi:hypothetical protein